MEDKREIVRSFLGKGLKLEECLKTVMMSKSTYYYRRNYRVGGKSKTNTTMKNDTDVPDDQLIGEIKALLSKKFIDYGYRKVTTYLKREGYKIGKKKTYRLMDENGLLHPRQVLVKTFDKEVIKQKPKATKPLKIIEVDIKYVYIDGEGRNAYLITIFDVFHRQAYNWSLTRNMRAKRVVELILEFIDQHLIKTNVDINKLELSFRTDNGSQFVSDIYRKLMEKFSFKNVYLPPATPQLNGHIESFHSTVQELVCDSHEFESLDNAKEVFSEFYETYNNERYLTCLLDYPPTKFIELWNKGLIGQKEHKKKLIFFFKEEDKELRAENSEKLTPSL
jgi:putative transposase